jgi:ABC-type nitrate/sulfonate/bicarbonate transport system substrate-binding protein
MTTARHITRRRFVQQGAAGLGALSLSGWLAACGGGSSGGPAALKLSLPTVGGAGSVWRSIIDQDGLTEGVPDREWIGGDPGQVQTQLLSGVVDYSVFGAQTAATANAKGADVLLVGAAINNHGRWLVPSGSSARTPKDLRGKRIASQPSNSDTFAQAAIVAALGGDSLQDDYELFFGAPAANLALFERGDVDGIIAIEPTATRLVAGGATEIARVGDLWKDATGSDGDMLLNGRAVKRSLWEERRTDLEAVTRMFTEANSRIREDPSILSKLYAPMGLKATEKRAIELLPERMKDVYPATFDAATLAGLDRQLEEAVKLGLLPKAPAQPVYAKDAVL